MSISVFVYDAYIGDPETVLRALSGNLIEQMTQYSHVISVDGGYKSMNISFADTISGVNYWYENVLGKHIVTMSSSGVIWEGFINEVAIELGGLSLSVGPLLDMSNRIYVTYSAKSWDPYGVTIGGGQRTTDPANNTDSQALYGVMSEYVGGGQASDTEAEALRDTYLADRSHPFISQASISLPSGAEPSVTLNCVGYYSLFDKWTYYVDAGNSEDTISNLIEDVIGSDPSTNDRISTDYSHITTNSMSIPASNLDQKQASAMLKEYVSYGDTSGNRYILGVYNDRKVHYSQVESSVFYSNNMSSPGYDLELVSSGTQINPWDVRPGKWLLLVGSGTNVTSIGSIDELRLNPYAVYIEEVSYTAPYTLSLSSGPTSTFAQKIARMGLEMSD